MSKAFRCDALDTPHAYISREKMSHSKWGRENVGIGAKEPFLALSTVIGAQYVQVDGFQAPISRMGVIGLAGTPFGSSGTPTGPKRDILAQNRPF